MATVAIAAENAHPFEFIIGNVCPYMLGPTLLGNKMHQVTLLIWTLARIGEAIDAHSGYEIPWSPFRLMPFNVTATYHDFHHMYNVGNYCT